MDHATEAASAGLTLNSTGGAYRNGVAYSSSEKWRFISEYKERKASGLPVSERALAQALQIGKTTARKIINEAESGEFVNPEKAKKARVGARPQGAGSKTQSANDEMILLQIRMIEPTTQLKDYRRLLQQITGTDVSEPVLCRWFDTRFQYSASLRKPCLVPKDKFKPENVVRMSEYIDIVKMLICNNLQHRLKFGDEKHLKGGELFARNVRRCPLTGETPAVSTDPDFRNTYSIIGFCGIDVRNTYPVYHSINMLTNDSVDFAFAIEMGIAVGYFQRDDWIILDRAAVHIGSENDVLRDYLWNVISPHDGQPMRINLLLLPARCPELNPIELIWSLLVSRLRYAYLNLPQPASHAPVHFTNDILNKMTHVEIANCYRHCGYFPKGTEFCM